MLLRSTLAPLCYTGHPFVEALEGGLASLRTASGVLGTLRRYRVEAAPRWGRNLRSSWTGAGLLEGSAPPFGRVLPEASADGLCQAFSHGVLHYCEERSLRLDPVGRDPVPCPNRGDPERRAVRWGWLQGISQ